MFSQKFFSKHQFISTALAVFASVIAVAAFVFSATTIGTNVSVDGNLTVSDASATSTFSGGLTAGNNIAFVVNQAASANSLYIAANGNVGIGTTSPSAKLDIAGDLRVTGGDWSGLNLYATASGQHQSLTINHPEGSPFQIFTDYTSGRALANIYVGGNGTMWITNNKIAINSGAIPATTAAALTVVATGNTPALVTTTGDVGIGTTTPYSRFHVSQGASATTTVNFGEVGSATSKACFNTKNVSGADISFYFSAANALVIENNLCR